MTYRALILCLLVPAATLRGEIFAGKVVQVIEGDRVVVRDEFKRRTTVVIAGIDAPKKKQPGFWPSRANLAKLLMGRRVTVEYFRFEAGCPPKTLCPVVGRVLREGDDIALKQLRAGHAWHDMAHVGDQSTTDRELYSWSEEQARNERLGLWKRRDPVPPWKFEIARKPTKAKPKKKRRK